MEVASSGVGFQGYKLCSDFEEVLAEITRGIEHHRGAWLVMRARGDQVRQLGLAITLGRRVKTGGVTLKLLRPEQAQAADFVVVEARGLPARAMVKSKGQVEDLVKSTLNAMGGLILRRGLVLAPAGFSKAEAETYQALRQEDAALSVDEAEQAVLGIFRGGGE